MGKSIGLGDQAAKFKVYIANRPNFENFTCLDNVQSLSSGQIKSIGQACGNGWRKVFNVYAKLVFALADKTLVDTKSSKSWQDFREQHLLKDSSNTTLLFSAPDLDKQSDELSIHIIMGKAYGKSLELPSSLLWLDNEFAIDVKHRILICPYFDYRQLSNIKIIRLVELIKTL